MHRVHKTIHKLRQQPEEVRRQILHIIVFACAIVLILFWITNLSRTLSNKDTVVSVKKDLQPFSVLKDNLTNGYQSVTTPALNQ